MKSVLLFETFTVITLYVYVTCNKMDNPSLYLTPDSHAGILYVHVTFPPLTQVGRTFATPSFLPSFSPSPPKHTIHSINENDPSSSQKTCPSSPTRFLHKPMQSQTIPSQKANAPSRKYSTAPKKSSLS